MIASSFIFEDGEPIPIYAQKVGNKVRIFDDGETLLHFRGRGIIFDDARKTRFIKNILEEHDVGLSENGHIEVWTDESTAPVAFSKYISAIVNIITWERNNIGFSNESLVLVAEVEQYLKAWKPNANITSSPEYYGISGEKYNLDFNVDGEAVLAINPHHSAISSAIKKLVDITSKPENSDVSVLAIIDDRYDKDRARRSGLIIESLAKVWPITKLEKHIGMSKLQN